MKTYLKDLTPEEVIRRLKAGESIKYDTSDAETKYCDGILWTIRPDGGYTINVQINSCFKLITYFETPDELKLEVGKCYRTKNGRKAFISYYEASTDKYYGIIYGENLMRSWNPNGECLTVCENKDLISEWSDDDVAED